MTMMMPIVRAIGLILLLPRKTSKNPKPENCSKDFALVARLLAVYAFIEDVYFQGRARNSKHRSLYLGYGIGIR